MDVIIQSLGFRAGPELEGYVKEKLQKVDDKADNIIRADVTLFIGSAGDPENHFCEIRLEIPGNDLFVKKNATTFELAVVDAVHTLQNVMRKTREKMSDHRP
jgi:putative sigma-54 modulation protein